MKRIDIPSLLERLGIKTKRKGRELWACCPLHEERTPSWQIRDDADDPEKHGRWRCLGKCHTGGGPVSLVMAMLGLEAKQAWEWIKTGSVRETVPLEIRFDDNSPDLSRFLFGFQLPQGVEFGPLFDWPAPAAFYAQKRGITAGQIDKWGIGYAIDGRLAKRIVIPWRDSNGKLLGYTARAYTPNEKRYLQPKEEERPAQGVVYGEEHWPPPGAARDVLIVIEGEIDGLAVDRATGFCFGAACGSNFVPAHASKFSTFKRVMIAGDPDAAGNAMTSSIVRTLAHHTKVIPIELPVDTKGGIYDPARLAVECGNDALRRVIEGVL